MEQLNEAKMAQWNILCAHSHDVRGSLYSFCHSGQKCEEIKAIFASMQSSYVKFLSNSGGAPENQWQWASTVFLYQKLFPVMCK